MTFRSALDDITLSKHRVEALADGVFAIVMTLLVLELKIPELPKNAPQSELLHGIRALLPVFFSYFITFMLAGGFWFFHHLSFHFIRHTTRGLCFINLLFLLFVSLLPFSTGLLGHFLRQRVAQYFYFGNQLAIGMVLLLHWTHARRNKLFIDNAVSEEIRALARRLTIMPAGTAVALVISTFNTEMSFQACFFTVMILALIERRRARQKPRI
jgi:uncharacterized membrane protein